MDLSTPLASRGQTALQLNTKLAHPMYPMIANALNARRTAVLGTSFSDRAVVHQIHTAAPATQIISRIPAMDRTACLACSLAYPETTLLEAARPNPHQYVYHARIHVPVSNTLLEHAPIRQHHCVFPAILVLQINTKRPRAP